MPVNADSQPRKLRSSRRKPDAPGGDARCTRRAAL